MPLAYIATGSEKHSITYFRNVPASTSLARIRRHDRVCELISTQAKERAHIVLEEPIFGVPSRGNLKPDLVIVTNTDIYVIDVQITSDGEDSLALSFRGKVERYDHDHIRNDLERRYPGRKFNVTGMIWTAHGITQRRPC